MAARKRPSGNPPTPSADQGIAYIQAQPFADPINRASIETPERTAGGTSEFEQAQADFVQIGKLVQIAEQLEKSFFAPTFSETVNFNGRDWDKKQFGDELARLRDLQTKATKRYEASNKVVFGLEDKVAKAKDNLDQAKMRPGNRSKITALQNKVDAAEKQLLAAKSVPAGTEITPSTIKATSATTTATGAGAKGASVSTRPTRGIGATASQMGSTVSAPSGSTATTQPTSSVSGAQNPSARNRIGRTGIGGGTGGTGQTGGTGGKGGKGGKGGAATPPAATDLDVASLKEQYPGYAWVWDLAPEFDDTKKLWADFLGGTITAERFNNLIGQSSWYTDQRTIGETRRIKNRYGDILDSGTMAKLVNESLQFDYEDDELDNAFFTSALARNVITGEYIDGRAAKTALASNVANSYRNYAKAMFLSTDDQEIEDVLTGKMTAEDFNRTKRQVAQATYKNWADLLNDPAMTMDKIVKPWKDMAASVLELDPTQIDMTKPQFSVAYAGSPDGKMGAMSLGEWYIKLRSDSAYGWDKTTQAKQEAQELGYNIAKAFGKV